MNTNWLRASRAMGAWLGTFSLLALSAVWAAETAKKAADKPEPPDRALFEPEAEQTPPAVKHLMQDRKYAEAADAIGKLLATKAAKPADDEPHEKPREGASTIDRDWLSYLRARALHLAGRYEDAVAAYEQLEKEFPESRWLRRAKFGRAVSLARKGDFQAAEVIYREQAAWLLSLDRKQEIADIYLEFADAYFKPADEQQQPDYQKALQFYTQALEVGPKPEKRAEVELLGPLLPG
ncbi:MAG TPA: tetratricopeptide repeat protein, partial [Pirellulales bacterium]|nr:tetratricopeptide repeat protein [Pirellulales bacterium]